MLRKLLYGLMSIVAVVAVITITSCGHYSAKGIKAELVWKNWTGA